MTATSSLGSQTYVGSKSLAGFCCEFLNLQRLAESAFCGFVIPNETQTRQAGSLRTRATPSPEWLPGLHQRAVQGGGNSGCLRGALSQSGSAPRQSFPLSYAFQSETKQTVCTIERREER